jgi:hypothetical protein
MVDGEMVIKGEVFTLESGRWVMSSVLHYIIKLMKSTLGMRDPHVAFFPSYSFTKLYQTGHVDPEVEKKCCYTGVAR